MSYWLRVLEVLNVPVCVAAALRALTAETKYGLKVNHFTDCTALLWLTLGYWNSGSRGSAADAAQRTAKKLLLILSRFTLVHDAAGCFNRIDLRACVCVCVCADNLGKPRKSGTLNKIPNLSPPACKKGVWFTCSWTIWSAVVRTKASARLGGHFVLCCKSWRSRTHARKRPTRTGQKWWKQMRTETLYILRFNVEIVSNMAQSKQNWQQELSSLDLIEDLSNLTSLRHRVFCPAESGRDQVAWQLILDSTPIFHFSQLTSALSSTGNGTYPSVKSWIWAKSCEGRSSSWQFWGCTWHCHCFGTEFTVTPTNQSNKQNDLKRALNKFTLGLSRRHLLEQFLRFWIGRCLCCPLFLCIEVKKWLQCNRSDIIADHAQPRAAQDRTLHRLRLVRHICNEHCEQDGESNAVWIRAKGRFYFPTLQNTNHSGQPREEAQGDLGAHKFCACTKQSVQGFLTWVNRHVQASTILRSQYSQLRSIQNFHGLVTPCSQRSERYIFPANTPTPSHTHTHPPPTHTHTQFIENVEPDTSVNKLYFINNNVQIK